MIDRPGDDRPSSAGAAWPNPGPQHRSGILHGRRQGRRLRDSQSALLDDLLPRYALDLGSPLDPAALFGVPVDELRLEVGFGGGEHLAAQAAQHPRVGFIGCEPFRNGVVRLLQHLEQSPSPTVRIHASDAGALIDRLPDASLSRVHVLYPDPWPKRRQRKRRFISAAMLARLARVMRSGAELHFATDIDDYAGWTLARVLASPDFAWTAREADDWRKPWAGWQSTRYESKAERAGRPPAYFTFLRR